MLSHPASAQNRLLAALPPAVLTQLLPKLSRAALPAQRPIYTPASPMEAVYFPLSGMVSLITNFRDGTQAEVGIIGREGMLGAPLIAGVTTPFTDCVVQMPGEALRMGAGDFRSELDAHPAFRALLLRYNEALHAQVTQTAACNGRHGLAQRLARWLLMAHDRAEADELPLTQDAMAVMLGVRRPSITLTAGRLQGAGLIRCARGVVTVLDRPGLQACSCECHGAVRRRSAALLCMDAG